MVLQSPIDVKERLRRLHQQIDDARNDNKKEAALERREQRLKDKQNVINPDTIEADTSDTSKLLDYTIEQVEKWTQAQEAKKGQGFANFNQVASRTYKKELAGVEVDKDSYKKQKEEGHDSPLAFLHTQTNEEARQALVQNLKENDERKTKKRQRGGDTSDSFINRKNKDFNKKLDRQYKKEE